jgi:cytochrome oxidase Cu insertion factor (SCO1/SenC/PrrC family)
MYFYSRLNCSVDAQKSVGTAAIGGPWILVNHEGVPTSSAEFQGKYQLIYFGFTFCPDVCPTELSKMSQVVSLLGNASCLCVCVCVRACMACFYVSSFFFLLD